MTRVRKIALFIVLLIVNVSGVGYVTAKMAQPSIEQATRDYVISNRISGLEFGGRKVPPEEIKVTSWVEWPYIVVGSYSVPFDLHGSYHRTTYLVMPWGMYELSKDDVHLV